ncbi:L-2-hydroxycarboxylate dehydrogenase (NAD+) [Catalinimonas alkaloidigena]|uniref:Ldh family oxidoreductase n=1 Tax=Catalinimonas alkaloidigena TaxID=1075417 RepID=UPI00240576EA|nr:Ldh family oxidoreductase [Catalinimonas alkaloidigena]MDF9795598.1 L-2-hydroxycarboxylate dehydrogenase (NAD+) [Catalinimonas alkaloidigena]
MANIESFTFSSAYLKNFTREVFRYYGVSEQDAELASDILAMSDLRGIESHGVARLQTYVGLLKAGRINPKPNIKIIRQKPSTATVDGDNGLGLVVGPKANEIAMEKAEQVGSGWVGVCHTNHFGIAGYYPLQALKRDMIGWALTNTTKIVTPLWGMERMLGTNPIAIAFPALEEPPIVIDMATSVAAFGKVEIAKREQKPIPTGWGIDSKGNDTQIADALIEGGALLPLGTNGTLGAHKGYALSSMVDILSAVLSGANWGPFTPPFTIQQTMPERSVGKGIGHFFGAMQIDGFIETDEFKRQMDDWIRTFRKTKAVPGTPGPLIPGDPERAAEAIRSVSGIPLIKPVVDELLLISKVTAVPFDLNEAK